MNQIEKLFKLWNDEHADAPSIRKLYCQLLEYLYENCPEPVREEIASQVLDFSIQAEQEAYAAGFRECFSIWMTALSTDK